MTDKKQEPRTLTDEELRAFWNIKCNLIDCCPVCQGTDLNCKCYMDYSKLWSLARAAAAPSVYGAEDLRLPLHTTWGALFLTKYPGRKIKSEALARKVLTNQLPIEAYDKAVAEAGVKQPNTAGRTGVWKYGGR
jgi:hypothetical protein